MKLSLPTVTIWSCCWTPEPERIARHLRVLKYCQGIIDCPRIVLFSALKVPVPDGIELMPIDVGPSFNWNTFVNREVPRFMHTEFAMSVHEDGFPLQTDLWDDAFLKYDYIGAPWKDNVVGNGGFNIESLRLMREKLLVPPSRFDAANSDDWVCRAHRERFERNGITFAPVDVAARFSTELGSPEYPNTLPSFGFHDIVDNPEKYAAGWSLIEEFERSQTEYLKPLKIAVVYVYANQSGKRNRDYTARFIESYRAHPPGVEHDTVVIVNGTKLTEESQRMFSDSMPNCLFLYHDNSGYDIGAYQFAARVVPCDMMVFFGASAYLNGAGWLARMLCAFLKHGNAQYGTMGNRGNLNVKVWPHIRTTSFWMAPDLMNAYPHIVTTPDERHPFEHGKDCFTNWVTKQGLKTWVVTWTKELLWEDWDSEPNGYSRGNQSSMIAGDRMCEPPYFYPLEQNGHQTFVRPMIAPIPISIKAVRIPPKPYRCFNP